MQARNRSTKRSRQISLNNSRIPAAGVAGFTGEAAALASVSAEVANRIGAQMGKTMKTNSALPHDTRRDAMPPFKQSRNARADAQQLQDATQAADVQFQAHDLVDRLTVRAKPLHRRQSAAARTVERGQAAETDAVKQTRHHCFWLTRMWQGDERQSL